MDGHKWTRSKRIAFGYNLEKSRPEVFQIASIKVVWAQNHLVCDVMIILSVKEFHITMFEF